MRITPPVLTDINNRVMGLNDHQKQVVRGRLVPLTDLTQGWIAGGELTESGIQASQSTIDRINFANDTAISQVRGPLSQITAFAGSHNNLTDGWVAGGSQLAGVQVLSTVQRIIFSSDANIATLRGNLSLSRLVLSGGGNQTDGWFIGGVSSSGTSAFSRIDRITFASDNTTASIRGNAPQNISGQGANGNNTNLWFFGGFTGSRISNTSRLTFAQDTSAAINRGTLTVLGENVATGNITDSWIAGFSTGVDGTVASSTVNRVTFTNDTTTAQVRGNLQFSVSGLQVVENTSTAWFTNGLVNNSASLDTIQRLTFSNDTVQLDIRGNQSRLCSASTGVS